MEPKPLAMSPGESAVWTLAATYRGGAGEFGVEAGAVGVDVAEFTGADARAPPPLLQPPTDDAAASRTTAAIGARADMSIPPPAAGSRGLRHDRAAADPKGLPDGEETLHDGVPPDSVNATDPPDFSSLFQARYDAVARAAYLIVQDRDTAQDVTQEAFIRTLIHWRRVQSYDRPDLWVHRVAVRLAIRAAKQSRLRTRPLVETDLVAMSSPSDLDLMKQIAQLPAGQRAAIVLHYLEDRPVAEVAEILRCSVATAKVHLHRGRKRLAVLLDVEGVR